MLRSKQPDSLHRGILIVVPWLEGGGAQGALEGILRQLPKERTTLLILFGGNRNHESAKILAGTAIELNLPRNPLGVVKAARHVGTYVREAVTVYSLMRASHLVLGMQTPKSLAHMRLAATFHQLPSQDSKGLLGKVEDLFVKRGVKHAGLITAPSSRAVRELISYGFGSEPTVKLEHNLIKSAKGDPVRPRSGSLDSLRLVFAGRLSRQKGLDRLPELLSDVRMPVHVRCIGEGEEKEAISALSSRLNDRHTLELLPHLDDITPHLDWSDAVIMPSRWELNPLVVWEARARGRATIGSRIEAFEDLSETGPMLLFRTADEFREILKTLATSYESRLIAFDEAIASSQNANTRSAIVSYLGI